METGGQRRRRRALVRRPSSSIYLFLPAITGWSILKGIYLLVLPSNIRSGLLKQKTGFKKKPNHFQGEQEERGAHTKGIPNHHHHICVCFIYIIICVSFYFFSSSFFFFCIEIPSLFFCFLLHTPLSLSFYLFTIHMPLFPSRCWTMNWWFSRALLCVLCLVCVCVLAGG